MGFLSFAGAVSNPANSSGLITGPVIILGALAYRSAKKRKLGEVRSTTLRKVLEASALGLVAAAILLQRNLVNKIVEEPFSNVFIPLWVFIAYVVIASNVRRPKEPKVSG